MKYQNCSRFEQPPHQTTNQMHYNRLRLQEKSANDPEQYLIEAQALLMKIIT